MSFKVSGAMKSSAISEERTWPDLLNACVRDKVFGVETWLIAAIIAGDELRCLSVMQLTGNPIAPVRAITLPFIRRGAGVGKGGKCVGKCTECQANFSEIGHRAACLHRVFMKSRKGNELHRNIRY